MDAFRRRHRPAACSASAVVILLLSLLSLLLPPVLSQSDCDTCLSFSQLNKDDVLPWTPRAGATLLLHPRAVSYLNSSNLTHFLTAPANSLVMFGGDASPLPIFNDVWLSSDRGRSWTLIAGSTRDGTRSGPSFQGVRYSAVAAGSVRSAVDNSSAQVVLKVGGVPMDGHEESFVFKTFDLAFWADSYTQNLPRYQLSAAVVNSSGSVLLIGGQQQNRGSQPVADVWHTEDGGRTWDILTAAADFGPRFSHSALALTGKQALGTAGADVVLVVGGTDGPRHFNDVWASSDAVKWKKLTSAAAFSPRRDFSLLATLDGVLVLTAGHDTATSFNDLFTSFDGGYTWHEYQWTQSSASASAALSARHLHARLRPPSLPSHPAAAAAPTSADQYPARHSHMAAFDSDGSLCISGGISSSGQYLTDITRSSISFSDSARLALVFDAAISRCGIGLYCFDDSTSVVAGGSVTCSGCSEDSLSMTTLGIVLAVITCAFVAFIVWRNFFVKPSHDKPIGVNEHLVNEDEVDE